MMKSNKAVRSFPDPYSAWIRENEAERYFAKKCLPLHRFPVFDEFYIVSLNQGNLHAPTEKWIKKTEEGCSRGEIGLIYADEDAIDSQGRRFAHFMKPEYSPHTLRSYFYFGSVVLLNKKLVAAFISDGESYGEDLIASLQDGSIAKRDLYGFVLRYTGWLSDENRQILHIPEIMFHHKREGYSPEDPLAPEVINEEAYWGYEPEYDAIKDRPYEAEHARVSVIIPTKEHPGLLASCITSLLEHPDRQHDLTYEIIIVDNGSSANARGKIEKNIAEWKEQNPNISYIYEKQDFNFSAMCNLGAQNATGQFLLFLNDDIEIIDGDFLYHMLIFAGERNVGAVGAKLLYPGSDRIQHTGVVNLKYTPEHKLMGQSDGYDHYYGKNRYPYDISAVTAACLLIEKEKFDEIGGFDTALSVSYNDVDLCFTLSEKGYYNVMQPMAVLYHHESASRGSDAQAYDKWLRQMREREYLYQKHPDFCGYDPFYSPNLSQTDLRYFCDHTPLYADRNAYSAIKRLKKPIAEKWMNDCLIVTIEDITKQLPVYPGKEPACMCIRGWSLVLGMDNSRYRRSLILQNDEGIQYQITLFDFYRPDVENSYKDQKNVSMAGFYARIPCDSVEKGTYRISMLCEDTCSRQKLYRMSDEIILID